MNDDDVGPACLAWVLIAAGAWLAFIVAVVWYLSRRGVGGL